MPNTALSSMLALTLDYRAKDIYNQLIRQDLLLTLLRAKKHERVWKGGGENLEFNVRFKRNDSFQARAYKEQIQFKEQDPLQTVELPRRFVNGNVMWYNAQEDANTGPFKIKSLTAELIDDALEAGKYCMASEMWQGGTGEHLHGIPAIVDHDNTYATITRAPGTDGNAPTYGSPAQIWSALDTDAGHPAIFRGTTSTFGPYHTSEPLVLLGGTDGGLTHFYNDLCDDNGENGPDLAITSETLYNKLVALIGADVVRQNTKVAEMGFPRNIQYNGMTIVWDRKCGATAGTPDATTFYALNTDYLFLEAYDGYDKEFKRTGLLDLAPTGIMAKAYVMTWSGNLICTRPSRQGRLTGKTA